MITRNIHITQPDTPNRVTTRDEVTHRLLGAINTGTVLRHPHPTERHAWSITLDGDGRGTLTTLQLLAGFEKAGLITWWKWQGKFAPIGAQRAYTTTAGDRTLQDWDTAIGLTRPAPALDVAS